MRNPIALISGPPTCREMFPATRTRGRLAIGGFASAGSKPFFVIPAACLLFLIFGVGPNYPVALLACGVLVAGTFLLWRPGEPQILLFLFALQWLQPTIMVFYANLCDMTLVELMPVFPGVESAVPVVLFALLFFAFGIRFGAGKQQPIQIVRFRETIQRIPPTRWLQLHLMMLAVSAAQFLAQAIPGLSQPLLALANFKWATFLIFTISTFVRPDGPRTIWLAVFCLEFVMSLGGYFSSFKSVFYFTLIALTAVSVRLSARQVIVGMFAGTVMLFVGLYWSAIKSDYRAFVNAAPINRSLRSAAEKPYKKLSSSSALRRQVTL